MDKLRDKEERLTDLWLPQVLPVAGAGKAENPRVEPTFVLTGWRGAGWRMVFLDELG